MRLSDIILSIVSLLALSCGATSLNKEEEDAIFDAIAEGRVQDLDGILEYYQGDIIGKIFLLNMMVLKS